MVATMGLVLAVTAAVETTPASAAATQSYPVPANRQLALTGHGFGHGHGMSQYGAQGAARQGLTYRQILAFYYPGTTLSTVSGPVRVLVSADTTSDVVVDVVSGLVLRDLGSGKRYRLPTLPGVTRWRITVGAGNRSFVDYLDGSWRRWRPGGQAALVGDGQLWAPTPITLQTPYGPRTYRGALRAASPTPGSALRDTVNVLSMDNYVRGVVAREMPASWLPEAVRSQAVAARTYATWSRNQYLNRYYQICDTSACQVYGGVAGEDPRSNAAVSATSRQVLTYGGSAAFTQFSSSSGGWLSAGSRPYLVAKADPYDDFAGNPVHRWTTTLDAGRVERAYPAIGTLRAIRVTARDGHGDWGGRVVTLVLDGSRSDLTMSGERFQYAFGLRSTWFTVKTGPARTTQRAGASPPTAGGRV